MAATKRIAKELGDLTASPPTGYTITTPESNLFIWPLTLAGPPGTAFENGKFQLHLSLPQNYPFSPPTLTFLTKIYHPNVSSTPVPSAGSSTAAAASASAQPSASSSSSVSRSTGAGAATGASSTVLPGPGTQTTIAAGGAMCLPMLKAEEWKPSSKISGVLEAARQLLVEPNIDDAIETDIADVYKNDRKKWEKTARDWCKRYAS